ncbi:MAG: ferredoxin--NADP reductase [Pseudomonadota bacterium]
MAKYATEHVLDVHHWNETLFSFRTTRNLSLRFRNGEFIMIGLENEQAKPIMRAYSIASANHDEHLEFFSIKVPDGALTSRLQHLKPGDDVLIGSKPTGTLVLTDLTPAKNLYLLATGTGLAPFLSIVQDPETYAQFDKVILVHGVRWKSELAYAEWLTHTLPNHEYLGEFVREKLLYYPTVTREAFRHAGRITHTIESDALADDLGLPPLNPETDRVMICGSPAMLTDMRALLDARGFAISPKTGVAGDYVIERAFVER